MSDKPTARVVALIALLILVAAALRGYIPAPDGARPEAHSSGNRGGLMFLVAALAATLALVAFSIIARYVTRAGGAQPADLSEMLGGGGARPSWRVILIALGVIVAWLLITILLSRLFAAPNRS